jgi:hypothetical protein
VTSEAGKQRWASIADAVLAKSGDEGKAVRIANYDAKKRRHAPRRRKKRQ